MKRSGFSAELASVIAEEECFDFLDAPIIRLAGKRKFQCRIIQSLRKKAVPQVEDIVESLSRIDGIGGTGKMAK